MATDAQLLASISGLETLAKRSALLPLGIVAARLYVSKQRLSDLIRDGVVKTERLDGCRLVVVDSALTFAKARYRRICKACKRQRP